MLANALLLAALVQGALDPALSRDSLDARADRLNGVYSDAMATTLDTSKARRLSARLSEASEAGPGPLWALDPNDRRRILLRLSENAADLRSALNGLIASLDSVVPVAEPADTSCVDHGTITGDVECSLKRTMHSISEPLDSIVGQLRMETRSLRVQLAISSLYARFKLIQDDIGSLSDEPIPITEPPDTTNYTAMTTAFDGGSGVSALFGRSVTGRWRLRGGVGWHESAFAATGGLGLVAWKLVPSFSVGTDSDGVAVQPALAVQLPAGVVGELGWHSEWGWMASIGYHLVAVDR